MFHLRINNLNAALSDLDDTTFDIRKHLYLFVELVITATILLDHHSVLLTHRKLGLPLSMELNLIFKAESFERGAQELEENCTLSLIHLAKTKCSSLYDILELCFGANACQKQLGQLFTDIEGILLMLKIKSLPDSDSCIDKEAGQRLFEVTC